MYFERQLIELCNKLCTGGSKNTLFAWETTGRKIFRQMPAELFPKTKALAANQGLYNGFLVAGLIWSLVISDPVLADRVALFFLTCVLIAGVFGAVTASKKIFYVQGVPAMIGIVLVLFRQSSLFWNRYLWLGIRHSRSFLIVLLKAQFFSPFQAAHACGIEVRLAVLWTFVCDQSTNLRDSLNPRPVWWSDWRYP